MIKRILTGAVAAALLAAATMSPGLADEGATLVADAASGVAVVGDEVRVPFGTSAGELLSCFKNRDRLTLKSASGEDLTLTDGVATGAVLAAPSESVTVVVPGDVNGDGRINARDVIGAMYAVIGETRDGLWRTAADIDADGKVSLADVIGIMRYLTGWSVVFDSALRPAAAKDDDELEMYFASSMLRIARTDSNVHGTADGVIRMAKNEIEDAQIVLAAQNAKKDLTLEIGDIVNEDGDILEREVRYGYYYDINMFNDIDSRDFSNISGGWWADPYPKLRTSFDIGAKESQSFIVKVKTDAGTKAGWYSAEVTVKNSDGDVIKRAMLRVYVWDFALDAKPACDSLYELKSFNIAGFFQSRSPEAYDGSEWGSIYRNEWYEYVLENKMCPQHLPAEITSSEADAYMDDPRVTAFVTIDGRQAANFDDEHIAETNRELSAIYTKLSQKKEWLDKAYIYTIDEPWGAHGVEMVKRQWECTKAVLGDTKFQTILPFGNEYDRDLKMDFLERTWDYCNAFCPSSGQFTEYATSAQRKENPKRYPAWGQYLDPTQYERYGNLEVRYEMLRERKDAMWWYICCGPEYPYANFFAYYQGAWARVVFWQQHHYDIDGFLYWSMVNWYTNDSKSINLREINSGDGLLLYPGTFWGEGCVPVPSIRMEFVRDGVEDFQYLRQLERKLGRDDVVKKYTDLVAKNVVEFVKDYRDISSVRDEMGFMLESLGE